MSNKKNNRRSERVLAFQVLYALEFVQASSKSDIEKAFCNLPNIEDEKNNPEGFAYNVVQDICQKVEEIDEVIAKHSKNWRIERLGRIEITILRIAVYEMLFREDIPNKVSINESLELAKQFAENKSIPFINGVLDAINKENIAKVE